MPRITRAVAIANNEVAWLAWEIDSTSIPGCLGFHIVREYLDQNDQVIEERPLASYVAFKGQRNPEWQSQNTTVWPVQKFNWRDLTLRKKRNSAKRRPDNERVRYRIRAVGNMRVGLEPVEVIQESHSDPATRSEVQHVYEGKPIPLGYLTAPAFTNAIDVTAFRPPFTSSFTNGILSTQFLVNVLREDPTNTLLGDHLSKPGDWLRNYLAGDVLPIIRDFFKQPRGRFHAALYELADKELIDLLKQNASRLDLILSDAGSGKDKGGEPEGGGKQATIYDTENAPARALLRELADKPGSGCTLQNRLFNGSGHIGHNKFVVWLDDAGTPQSVLTGSTNWTATGVAGQSNNCIRIDDKDVAGAFFHYWMRLKADALPEPNPLNSEAKGANQGDPLKSANRTPARVKLADGATVEIWFSPNVPGKQQPPSKSAAPALPPPDMDRLFSLLRKAEKAVFFLVFMPSRGGINSIVSEAIALGLKDTSLSVIGAISDSQAMWGFQPGQTLANGKKLPPWSPHVFRHAGVSVVRATALTDEEIGRELGDFSNDERLTLGKAIIHDKVLVIDPMHPDNCVVAFGSHNLGYKASYSNDENLIIVQGHAALAQAYAAHVLDVYDHYRFRAAEAELSAASKAHGGGNATTRWDGFLDKTDAWQERASHRLSTYLTG